VGKALRWGIVVFCAGAVAGLAAAGWYRLSKPTILTVAVGPAEFDDAALIAAFGRRFAAGGSSVRLSIVPTTGPVEALDRLTKGEAQLAVVRSDGAGSDRARAVAVLHTDPLVIVTTEKAGIEGFGELKGKKVGVIGPPGANDALLRTLRKHYNAPGDTSSLAPAAAEVSATIRSRAVDALLFVIPTTRGDRLSESWSAVRRASRQKLTFVPLGEAEAIAASNPAYEAGEIIAGQFGGSPALPEESIETIQVATYLVAAGNVSADAITALTRELFQERRAVAAEAPVANLLKAASTDKDAVYPLHPGAKIYYEGEEKTLMERYGDWLFYGPMLLGALGSGLLVVLRFLGLQEEREGGALLVRLSEVIAAIKHAQSTSELEHIRAGVDGAVQRLAEDATRGNFNEQRTAVLSLAVSHVDHLIAERRELLLRDGGTDSSGLRRLQHAAN
jgi:uncharacterized protein